MVPSELKYKEVIEAVIFLPVGRGDLERRYWGVKQNKKICLVTLEFLPLDTCLVKTMIVDVHDRKKAIDMGISIFLHLIPFAGFAKKMKVVTILYHLHEI